METINFYFFAYAIAAVNNYILNMNLHFWTGISNILNATKTYAGAASNNPPVQC